MSTPDVTKAQVVGIVQALLAVAVAFGAPITETQSAAVLGLAGVVFTVLTIADAMIRRARAEHLAAPVGADELAAFLDELERLTRAAGETPTAVRPMPHEAIRETIADEAARERTAAKNLTP